MRKKQVSNAHRSLSALLLQGPGILNERGVVYRGPGGRVVASFFVGIGFSVDVAVVVAGGHSRLPEVAAPLVRGAVDLSSSCCR